ncbi:MAG: hypothetical protein A3H42_02530 [Deltaproteobacteria bacterium RIFCSPLOWO2_02_FULL_46_8]|nr:MAG: hypothetical protein A3H42_02530 [Deltaproteobacteria bacterium RIFCSPLOWO2_02_FULL_46_8]
MKLLFVTGKGGVGKSTVTAALATFLASLKYKVGVVELGESRMSDFFNLPPIDYEGVDFNPHIKLFNLSAASSFKEYAAQHLPKHLIGLLQNKWTHSFIDATPGLNEILLLGKIHSLATRSDFDFVLIDAPATGHAISLCDAPRIAYAALQHGPLKSTVGEIWDLLHDSKQTHFLIVTQLEPGIVQETFELYTHLTRVLQLSVKGLIVNGLLPEEPVFTGKIPDSVPEAMKGLVDLVKVLQDKFKRQKKILENFSKTFPLSLTTLFWNGITTDESHLRQTIGLELKQWVLKNYSTKKS